MTSVVSVVCLCQRNAEGVCFDIHSKTPPLLRRSLNTIRFTDARIPPTPPGMHEPLRKGIARQWLLGSCRTNNEKKIFKLGLRNFLCDDARPGPHNGSDTVRQPPENQLHSGLFPSSATGEDTVRAQACTLLFVVLCLTRTTMRCLHVAYCIGKQDILGRFLRCPAARNGSMAPLSTTQ